MTAVLDRIPGLIGGRDPRSWFDVERIDADTFAVHERRYWQRNINYLVVGSERALVLDTGSGLSDIAAVVAALTDRPVTALASHLHWDHTGGHPRFARVAAPALPALRRRTVDGVLRPSLRSRLAPRPRPLRIAEWLPLGEEIDLGGRRLRLHHAPGHTDDSIVAHDADRGQLFTGDLLYDGPSAFGLTPGSSLAVAARTVRGLVRDCPSEVVLGGHYGFLPGGRLADYAGALAAIGEGAVTGTGRLVREYRVDGFRVLLAHRGPRG